MHTFFTWRIGLKEIKISISGEEISLQRTLSSVLPQAGLHFYIDEDLQVFIYSEQRIIFTLPDYLEESTSTGLSPEGEGDKLLTNIEQRYIEGRKSGLRETITIGSGSGNENRVRSCYLW